MRNKVNHSGEFSVRVYKTCVNFGGGSQGDSPRGFPPRPRIKRHCPTVNKGGYTGIIEKETEYSRETDKSIDKLENERHSRHREREMQLTRL